MKLIHTSDLHLDSPLTARLASAKVRTRRRELIDTFDRIVRFAVSEGCDGVLISGDMFDSERISSRTLRHTLDIINAARDIKFFYVSGNHEGNALRDVEHIPENLIVFGDDWGYCDMGDTVIAARCSVCENMFDTLQLDLTKKNIVMLHGELGDYSSHSGTIGLSEAKGKGIDYLALGHYHSYSETKIDDRGVAVYCGVPEGRGFDEVGSKGIVLLNVTDRYVAHRYMEFAKRKLHIVRVDVSEVGSYRELEDCVCEAIASIAQHDLVRVVLCGTFALGNKHDCEALAIRFGERYFYFEVNDETRLHINPDDYVADMSLKGEFIRLVMSRDDLDENEKKRIISCGISALAGESID